MPAPNGCCRSQKACASPATESAAVESNAVDAAATDSSARVFSRRATLITGAVASGALLASCAEGDSNVTAPEGTVEVGSASAVGVGKAARLTHGSTTVIVSQPSAGEYKAFSTVCTHQGCQVQVQDSNRIVSLPRLRVRRS